MNSMFFLINLLPFLHFVLLLKVSQIIGNRHICHHQIDEMR